MILEALILTREITVYTSFRTSTLSIQVNCLQEMDLADGASKIAEMETNAERLPEWKVELFEIVLVLIESHPWANKLGYAAMILEDLQLLAFSVAPEMNTVYSLPPILSMLTLGTTFIGNPSIEEYWLMLIAASFISILLPASALISTSLLVIQV